VIRSAITQMANIAVDALPISTRMKRRIGNGQRIANEVMSTRARIAASTA
jgi:hypothetical protein